MSYFLQDGHFTHFLAALVLLSRLGDVGSTWLVTPRLRLESNPIARRLGWPFAFVTLLLALIPYYNTSMGMVVLTVSFLVTGRNLSGGWITRALGEDEIAALMRRAVRGSTLGAAVGFVLASATAVALVGAFEVLLSDELEWGYWFGMGLVLYALVVALHGSLHVRRLFRQEVAKVAAESRVSVEAATA